jgi:hypothetical protein
MKAEEAAARRDMKGLPLASWYGFVVVIVVVVVVVVLVVVVVDVVRQAGRGGGLACIAVGTRIAPCA